MSISLTKAEIAVRRNGTSEGHLDGMAGRPAAMGGRARPAAADVAALVRALSEGNTVRLLVNGAEAEASARAAVGGAVDLVPRATATSGCATRAPSLRGSPEPGCAPFQGQRLGGKADIPGDETVGDDIARISGH